MKLHFLNQRKQAANYRAEIQYKTSSKEVRYQNVNDWNNNSALNELPCEANHSVPEEVPTGIILTLNAPLNALILHWNEELCEKKNSLLSQ